MSCWRFKLKIVDVYCSDIQKRIKKLLKKIFGYRTIADGLEERKRCRMLIENCTEKDINDVDFELIKKSRLCDVYAKYRTLNKILELYLESVCLQKFTIKELEEYGFNAKRC